MEGKGCKRAGYGWGLKVELYGGRGENAGKLVRELNRDLNRGGSKPAGKGMGS